MPNQIRDELLLVDSTSFPYIFEQNVTIKLKTFKGLVRCNIYRPKIEDKVPVLVTYGPYGKDIHYKEYVSYGRCLRFHLPPHMGPDQLLNNPSFYLKSYSELNPKHQSAHSSFETPDPGFWTAQGYAVLRADEVGIGQSPGILDTMSKSTTDAFADVIEWAAEQPWSNGKIGLVGISYFGGSQWRVAARQPKGLAAMVPVDGMADYYRDRCRHGGILTGFLEWWFQRQVLTNQYGLPGKASRNWGPDTIEGDLTEEELAQNRRDQTVENSEHFYRDDPYYASRDYNLQDIVTPLLSFGNWGSIMIHLRGNYEGFRLASSEKKFLRMNVGRHDLPFYADENVEVIKSFLDAFLKGDDRGGWTDGSRPPVELILRKGNVGYNSPEAERAFERRFEHEWPLARTRYTKFYLTPDKQLTLNAPSVHYGRLSYPALGNIRDPQFIQLSSAPLSAETEVTGYIVAHLNVSVTSLPGGSVPSDIDLFLTLRHFASSGEEVFYTGITGEPVPLCKGWQRVSLRKVNKEHPLHREWLPYRDYFSTDVLPVIPGEIYPVDVEVWATNVIAEKGDRLVLEVASGDTQGSGNFGHDTPERSSNKLAGTNHIHFSEQYLNWVSLPIIAKS